MKSPPMPDSLTIEVRDLGICLEDGPKSADLLKHALFGRVLVLYFNCCVLCNIFNNMTHYLTMY